MNYKNAYEELKKIEEQHQKSNGELRTELNDIKDLIISLQESCKQLDVSGLTICNIILKKIEEMEK